MIAARRICSVAAGSIIEFRLKISSTSDISVRFGLGVNNANASTNGVFFKYDTNDSDTNWQCVTGDANSNEQDNSGVSPDTSYHLFRIETSAAEVKYFIDGTQVASCSDTSHIQTALTAPVIQIIQRLGGANPSMSIDYWYIWGDRV